ncbi:MAG: type II toxin-antitoxin system VapC family toxin [Actinomycetia bacterium]|nr:type II toxin-antitoxin system VapC family toxin [Actinomycetes bacterium]MCP4084622.1 type II toxin-antitoxin system VapC family toxin [Actinomycetes bacterium]
MLIVLDSGPLGLLSNPTATGPGEQAQGWARDRISAGDQIIVPEVADYEVRRELIRAGKTQGIARLDELCRGLRYHPLSTPIMRDAAHLWAQARNGGYPTAHDAALDGDVLLAAQARDLHSETPDERIVIATTNVVHLERYVEAAVWSEL